MPAVGMGCVTSFFNTFVGIGVGIVIGWCARYKKIPSKKVISTIFSHDGDLKLVLVARTDLGMGKGKIAAQCSHAALGCYQKAIKMCPNVVAAWEAEGQRKIVLKGPDEQTLQDLRAAARKANVPHYLVHDAGLTQIAAGSATVLGIGPGDSRDIDQITGDLKLL